MSARRLGALLGATILLAACSSSNDNTGPGALSITPASPTVRVDSTVQLRVQGATGPVAWSSSDTTIATVAAGLVTGVATGTAKITAADGNRTATATVTVTAPPTIAFSAASVSFATASNGAVPAPQAVAVTNGGNESVAGLAIGGITYSAGASGWLTANIAPDSAPATLTVQPNTAALPTGTYTASVSVTSATAVNSPHVLTVTYVISQTPVIALGRTTASFSAQANAAAPSAQTISITNGGGGTLSGLATGTISYGAGANGWLSASINPTTAPATLTIQPTTTALAVGSYTATVPITSSQPGVNAQQVTVTYQITAGPVPPSIVLGATSVGFQATAGGSTPGSQNVSITNGGGGTLSGLSTSTTYGNGQPTGWLSASLNQTTAPATLTLQPTTVLSAGTYTAQVAIAAPGANNSPQTIAVTYTVNAPPVITLSATTAADTSTQASVDPPPITINVSNTGGGSLTGVSASVSYSGSTTGWLSATIASTVPQSPSSTPLTLQVTTGSIAPGTYTATVTVSSTVPGVASQNVQVSFTRIATLANDIMPIFTKSCASPGCHAPPDNDGVVLSSTDTAYGSLVNKAAVTVSGQTRVIPGDSVNSYLMAQLKAIPPATSSAYMPFGCTNPPNSSCLSSTLIHAIAVWIVQGARKGP